MLRAGRTSEESAAFTLRKNLYCWIKRARCGWCRRRSRDSAETARASRAPRASAPARGICAVGSLAPAPGRSSRQRLGRRSPRIRRVARGPGELSPRARSSAKRSSDWCFFASSESSTAASACSDSAWGASLRASSARECSRRTRYLSARALSSAGVSGTSVFKERSAADYFSARLRVGRCSTFLSSAGWAAAGFGLATPAFSRILPSISRASAGFSLRKSRELSLPWPRRSPL